MNARILLLPLTLSLAILTPACRSTNAYDLGSEADRVGVVVQNDNFADFDLYAVASGLATRLGTVNGGSTQHFDLNSSMYNASDFRIVGTPIGGNGRASTGPLAVTRGRTIYFTIAPLISASSVSIR
ncbi:MAG: hypothetical protein M3Z05_13635 [Gemmatimonadota bacterium]|nr:hypothetical protein [Gemmatimonadota bacterium]